MSLTPGVASQPSPSSPGPDYAAPSHADLAAVAATVSVVGVLMAILITWLVIRLRRAESQSEHLPVTRRPSYVVRPSFAPSEASSKFAFIRKPLRLSRRQDNNSWDFADPDPFNARPKDTFDAPDTARHRPAPLQLVTSPRARRASMHKDEFGLHTPSTPGTPASVEFVEPPPPAYCRDGLSSPRHQPMVKDQSPP